MDKPDQRPKALPQVPATSPRTEPVRKALRAKKLRANLARRKLAAQKQIGQTS